MTGFNWGGENGAAWGGPDGSTWGVGPPSPPDLLSVEAISGSEITLEWAIVGTVETIRIYRSREQSQSLTDYDHIATVEAPTESYTDDNLTNGRDYHYRLTATNAVGEGDPSDNLGATTDLPAPTLSFDTSIRGEIGITVTLEDDNDEGDVTLYRNGEEIATLEDLDAPKYVDDEEILDGEEYAYHAERDTGDSSVESGTEDVVAYLPGAEGLVMDASVQSELTAEWDAVLNNGRYRLEYRDDDPDGDHPDYEHVATVDYDGELEETIGDLVDGEQYSVRLRTETDYTESDWLEASPITKLVPASDVGITGYGTLDASIEWTNESEFRGSNQIYRRRADYSYGSSTGKLVGTVASDDTTFTDGSAQPDREYEYLVRALTQWVYADSESTESVETDGIGLGTRSVPADEPYIEIDHPDRTGPLTPEIETIQRKPTINGYPRLAFSSPPDDRWLDDALDDAEIRAWINGERQPIDVLEHRSLSPGSTDLEARGGTQLDRRVVENVDIEEALKFAEYVIEEYTDYKAVVDDPDDVVREDVLVQLAETLAELQAAFEEIPDDVPLEWGEDGLQVLKTCWLKEADRRDGPRDVEGDEYVNGRAVTYAGNTAEEDDLEFQLEYDIPDGQVEFVLRAEVADAFFDLEVSIDGQSINNPSVSSSLGWTTVTADIGGLEAGTHTVEVDGTDDGGIDDAEIIVDMFGVRDARYDYTDDNSVHEPGGQLDGPEEYPDVVHLLLEEINTPLSIVKADLDVTTDDGLGVAELAIGQDGTDEWDTATETLSHSIEYEELAATFLARVGLGRKHDLEPRDETPRLGYEPQRLESVEMHVDLDETPVVVNYQPDKNAMDVLREVVGDIADGALEIRPGPDGTEVHISRIDGRPTDVDPDLIDWSVERNTEDTVDRAIVYAGAESIRRLSFQADVDEWADLPLGDGRIVRGSETVYDATDDEESLERGEDYETVPNNPDGPPQIKLLTELDEPRIDCDFKPGGEHEVADLPDEPSVIIEDAPNLASQQMADIAAFQAVEGSYTDAVIDASITVPVDQIGWNVLDALNVANLPGDQPYQIKDGDLDPANGEYRLGAGRTGQEEIQQLNDETGRLSERV